MLKVKDRVLEVNIQISTTSDSILLRKSVIGCIST